MAENSGGGATRILPNQPDNVGSGPPASKHSPIKAIARDIYNNDRKLQLMLLGLMALGYGLLLWIGYGHAARTTSLRLTYNSMLAHLMRGRFDVDPQIVGNEGGFLRDGRVYAYWGIFPALLRLPLWIAGRMDVDLTLWSCLAAACVAGMAKVRAVLMVRRLGMQSPMAKRAVALMLAYVLLGGGGIGLLNASVYNEVIFWGGAFAAVFVYLAVQGVVHRRFHLHSLCWMALCAGLALLSRVSIGIGVIVALVLLLLTLAIEPGIAHKRGANEAGEPLPRIQRFLRALAARRTLLPAGILASIIAATGAVNYFRWGNPATFANWNIYLATRGWPEFLDRMHRYGAFNGIRIPFNFSYYFFPVWAHQFANGDALLSSRWGRTMIGVELPPSSFLLTDLVAFCFIALLAVAVWKRRSRGLRPAGLWASAVSAGLLVPCILMLTAIWVAYRYRMEFYPEIDFLALMGLYFTVTDEAVLALFGRLRRWVAAALAISVASSLLVLALLDVGQPLPPQPDPQGLVHYYLQITAEHYHKSLARHFASH